MSPILFYLKKYNILEDPVLIDSGILPHALQPGINLSQTNTMTDEIIRPHPSFNANLHSLCIASTT